jgi:cytochrome c556
MKRRARITFGCSLLALGLWSMTAYSLADDKKDAQEAVLKLMESINEKKGDVKAQAAAIKKKFDELEPIMYVYKARNKGGIGMKDVSNMKDGSSIETELGKIGNPKSKSKLTKQKVADLKDDLIKAGQLSRAIAEITELYAPKKDTAEWKKYTQDMRKASDELIEAAKGGEVAKIKKAAGNLSGSCTDCHSKFRND